MHYKYVGVCRETQIRGRIPPDNRNSDYLEASSINMASTSPPSRKVVIITGATVCHKQKKKNPHYRFTDSSYRTASVAISPSASTREDTMSPSPGGASRKEKRSRRNWTQRAILRYSSSVTCKTMSPRLPSSGRYGTSGRGSTGLSPTLG